MSININYPSSGGAGCNLFEYDETNFPNRVQNGSGSIIPYTAEKDGWVSVIYNFPLASTSTTMRTMQFGILKDDGRVWDYQQMLTEFNKHNTALLLDIPIHKDNSANNAQSYGPYYFKKGQKVIFGLAYINTSNGTSGYPWNAWLRVYK